MKPAITRTFALLPKPKKPGRPPGSVKDARLKLSDYVRTVALMHELLVRTTCANNANQFARWFDGTMRGRHPLIAWETERSGKWRKNLQGSVSLNRESIDHLQELFPDDRYYATVESRAKGRRVDAAHGAGSTDMLVGAERSENLDARLFYTDGPGRLWRALWEGDGCSPTLWSDPARLWGVYPAMGEFEDAWGMDCPFDAVLSNLEMRLFSNFDCGVPTTAEDLGRAAVLYRLQYEGVAGTVNDGIVAYLCVRLALADLSPWLRGLNVFDEISTYVVGMELDRLRLDDDYRRALEERYRHDAAFDPGVYAVNPFLWLSGSCPRQARRYDMLAGLSAYQNKAI